MKVKKTIEVCDVCEDLKRDVVEYTVQANGTKAVTVLCSMHSRPLEVILGNAKPTGRPPAKKAASRVTTVEEIEASKK